MSATLAATARTFQPAATAPTPVGDTVLIVEDDQAIGTLLKLLLAPLAPRVVHLRDGAACVRWFTENAAATGLVVMDCGLPDAHGGTLAHRLRTQVPALPILVTSGRPQPDVVRLLAADGPVDFLAKPFRPADVATRVRALLASRAAA